MDFVKTEDYLQVRGSATDQAAICTRTATFHLKELQTSNTILVCRNSSEEESHLLESVHSTWEIQPISPCFDKLYEYLISTSYSSLNSEINNIKPLWSWKTITSNIQASDAEILSALARIGAFELDGRWRILDINYALEILRELLLSVRIAVEDFKSIGKEKLQDLLFNDNVPQFVSDAILQNYGMVNADTGVFGLDMNKIGTLFAKSVLKSAKVLLLFFDFL